MESITYLGIPEFVWNGIFSVLTTLVAGLMVAYFTSTFLNKKEERTRITGIIVEERIESEKKILSFVEKSLVKEEANIGNNVLNDQFAIEFLKLYNISHMHLGCLFCA